MIVSTVAAYYISRHWADKMDREVPASCSETAKNNHFMTCHLILIQPSLPTPPPQKKVMYPHLISGMEMH